VRPEGSCHGKIPVIPSGFEPATFRLAAQFLIQLSHRLPPRQVKILCNFARYKVTFSHYRLVFLYRLKNNIPHTICRDCLFSLLTYVTCSSAMSLWLSPPGCERNKIFTLPLFFFCTPQKMPKLEDLSKNCYSPQF